MADLPTLPKSPSKDVSRPLQAGDRAVSRGDRDAADDLARTSRLTDRGGKPVTNRPARVQNTLRDQMAAGTLTARQARQTTKGSTLRSLKGRR